MSEAEYDAFHDRAAQEYAQDKVTAGQWPAAQAPARARQALAELLPAGLHAPGHCLYVLHDEATGGRVGTAWLRLEPAAEPPYAYLFDLRIDDAVQGRGYGRAALAALEAAARAAGGTALLLHTFGHNERARRLYESAGYRTTNVNLRKDLG